MFDSATSIRRRAFLAASGSLATVALLSDCAPEARYAGGPGASAPQAMVLQAPVGACAPTIPSLGPVPVAYVQRNGLLALRADALIQQIAKGYGYYGQPGNWVTLAPFDTLDAANRRILTDMMAVEDYLNCLVSEQAANQATIGNYQNTIIAAQNIQGNLQTQIDQYNSTVQQLLIMINELQTEIDAQKQLIAAAQAAFNQAVLDAATGSGGCGFAQAIEIVGAVVAVVSAVYTAGASLTVAYAAVSSLATTGITAASAGASAFAALKNAYEQIQPIVKKITTAEADLRKIGTAYATLRTDLARDPKSAKVAVAQPDLDAQSAKTLSDFRNSVNGAAGVPQNIKDNFIQTVQHYVDLTQTQNKKIYDHDAYIVGIQQTARQIAERDVEIAQVQALRATFVRTQAPPSGNEYVEELQNIRSGQLDLMKRLLWEQKGAQALVEVNPTDLDSSKLVQIIALAPADLLLTAASISENHNQYRSKPPGAITNFDPDVHKFVLQLTEDQRQQLTGTRRLSFTIPDDGSVFQDSMRQVFISGFKYAWGPGGLGMKGSLIHWGCQRFRRWDGSTVEFSSDVVSFGLEQAELTTYKDITWNGAASAGVSPFSLWTFVADGKVTAADLQQVRTFSLTFAGNYVNNAG